MPEPDFLNLYGDEHRTMKAFTAKIHKIDINPYVGIPEDFLNARFRQADKTKGPISVAKG